MPSTVIPILVLHPWQEESAFAHDRTNVLEMGLAVGYEQRSRCNHVVLSKHRQVCEAMNVLARANSRPLHRAYVPNLQRKNGQ